MERCDFGSIMTIIRRYISEDKGMNQIDFTYLLFERCVDFLARMIEKYGSELLQELNGLQKEDKAEDNCQQEQQQNTLGND